jgi:hypothetical protein
MAIINRVRVLTVGKGSNAEKAEIQINDIILSYNGVLIDSAETLNNEINNVEKDKDVIMRIRRSEQILTSFVTTEYLGITFRNVKLERSDRQAAMETIETCYSMPKKIAKLMSNFGWGVSVIGALILIYGIFDFSVIALTGFSILLSGIFIVMFSEVSMSIFDNTDINRELFLMQRTINERQ